MLIMGKIKRINKLDNTSVSNGMLWKILENISAQVVSFVVSIVIARILLPEDYGIIAMVNVFINIADVLITYGLSTSLIQKKDSDELDFSTIFVANLILSVLIYTILFIASPYIAKFYNNNDITLVLRVLGVKILFSAYSSIQQAHISRHMIFKSTSIASIISTICSAIIGIAIALNGGGVWALVFQQLSLLFVKTVVISIIIKWHPGLKFDYQRSKRLVKYGNDMLLANILNTASTQIRSLLIGRYYTDEDLAYYNRGDSYPNVIISSINNSLNVVLFAAYSKKQDDIEEIKNTASKSIRLASYIVLPILLGLFLVSKPLVIVLLTEKWLGCVEYLRIACFTYVTWVPQITLQQAVIGLGHSKIYLRLAIITTIINIISVIIAIKIGVLAISISVVFVNFVSLFIDLYLSKQYINYSILDFLKDICPIVVNCLVMAIGVALISMVPLSNLPKLILEVLVGVIMYIASSYVLKSNEFSWYINYILKIIKKN